MQSVIDPKIAQWYAARKHEGQRYGQQPYTIHLEMAIHELEEQILPLPGLHFYHHDVLRCAVWLHDVVEDTGTSIFELSTLFDPRVVELVDAVTDGPGENRDERKTSMYPKIRAIGLPAVAVKLLTCSDFDRACRETAIGREIGRKLALPGRATTAWEFNLVVPEGDGFGLIRMIEFFGERRIVPWTKFYLTFRLPMLRAQAAHLNKLAAAERERLGPEREAA